MTFKYFLPPRFLQITQKCHFKCDFCNLWKDKQAQNFDFSDRMYQFMQAGKFFNIFGSYRYYDIIGGDPLCDPNIIPILTYLRQYQKKIRIWTHTLFPNDTLQKILPLTNEIMIYVPSIHPETYQTITGQDSCRDFIESLPFIKKFYKKITLNHPVRAITVSELPDLYEFAYQHKLALLLHFNATEKFDNNMLQYIRRMNRIKNIQVRKVLVPYTFYCQAVSNF